MLAFGIKQTSTTTGAGNLTLASVSGFPQFNDCFPFANSRRFEYEILDSNGAPLENGIGYLTANATTLVREKVLATYSSGTYTGTGATAVSLAAGTKTVICGKGMATATISGPNIDSGSTTNTPRRAAFDPGLDFSSVSSGGFTLVADTLFLMPFRLDHSIECSGMLMRLGGGIAGKSLRMGLYELGASGFPTKLLGETSALSAASSGVDVSGSFSTNVRLSAGWYCVAINSDGAIGVGTAAGGARSTFFGMDSGHTLFSVVYRSASSTFGAMPNPAPTATNYVNSSSASSRIALGLLAA